MLYEYLTESKGTNRSFKKWLAFPVSLGLHTLVVGLLIAASYWFIAEAVPPPPIPMVIVYEVLPVPIGPPEPLPGPKPPEPPKTPPPQPEKPAELVQPPEIPDALPPAEIPNGNPAGSLNGSLNGVPGGVPNGVDNGVPGGMPGDLKAGPPDLLPGEQNPASTDDGIHPLTPDMKVPVQIKRVEPIYPRPLIKARIEGEVTIRAVIGKTGDVEEAVVIIGANPMLNSAALEAVMQWKYQPAMLDGRPVKVYFEVIVTFSIN